MKFGCFSLDFRRLPLETAFAAAERYGFDGLELWGGRPHACPWDVTAEFAAQIRRWKQQYHVEIPMYTPNAIGLPYNLCSMDPAEQQDALAYFRKAIDGCAAMEIPRMLLVADHPGYAVRRRVVWGRFVENLQELGRYAADKGVILVIEPLTPMESPVITTADDCADVLDDIGLPNVEAMLDVVPPRIAYEPLSSYFTKLGGRMHYIHLCNNDGRTDAHTRLEDGELPVEDMLQLFRDYRFDGYVTVELYSENYRDPELMLANTARLLKEYGSKWNLASQRVNQ